MRSSLARCGGAIGRGGVRLLMMIALSWQGVLAQVPNFSRLDAEEVQSLGGIFAIEQDVDGFLWFGGKNGMLRYDGYEFRPFRHDPDEPGSPASNDVSDLFVDSRGRLWAALLTTGGLNRFDYRSEGFIPYPADVEPGTAAEYSAYRVAEDPEGRIWVATHEHGLMVVDEETETLVKPGARTAALEGSAVRDIAITRDGTLWLATVDRGLWRMEAAAGDIAPWRPAGATPELDQQLFRVFVDRFDNVWIGSLNSGVDRYDPAGKRLVHYSHDPNSTGSIGAGMVWDMAEDATGTLWLATRDGALNRYDKWKDSFERFAPGKQAGRDLSGPVISLFMDKAGDLWLGTHDSEVNRLSERLPPFRVLHLPEHIGGVTSDTISAMYQSSDGGIWLAGASGLAYLSGPEHSPRKQATTGVTAHTQIRAIVEAPDGHLWLGTVSHGLLRMVPSCGAAAEKPGCSEPVELDPFDGLEDTQVWRLYQDRRNAIWIGTQRHGLYRYDPIGARMTQYMPDPERPASSLSHPHVWDILEDRRGRYWIGTQHGLNLFDRESGQFQHFMHDPVDPDSLSGNSVRALAEDREGRIWVATSSGLNRYEPDRNVFRVYRVRDGLPDDHVTGLIVDEAGHLWLTTQKGISRYDADADSFTHYDTRHGLAANAHPRKAAVLRLEDGELWFGSTGGISRIQPDRVRRNQFVPPVVLTKLRVANEPLAIDPEGPLKVALSRAASLRLPHPNPVFSIEFAALDFLVPTQNRYAYRLIGFDERWTEVGSERRLATYTNLGPGHYTFELMGSNSDGVWNPQPTQLHIALEPPWWRSGWAYLTAFFIVALALWLLWRLQQQKMILERNARNRAQQMDQFKDQVIVGLTRELRSPVLTIGELTGHLLRVHGAELSDDARQSVERLQERADHLAELMEDVARFEGVQNSESLGLNNRRIDLCSIISDVSAHYQSQAQLKGVRLYTRLPDSLSPVDGDARRLQQVFSKLLANAVRFTEHGYIEVAARRQSSRILIHIKDTGIGIDGRRLVRVREKIRSGGAGPVAADGLSLGLLSRILSLHGGQLLVESEVHGGTTFTVILPVAAD